MSVNQDSAELEALFDSILAAGQETSVAAPDSVLTEPCVEPTVADGAWPEQGKVFAKVGQMARLLHDTLSALGYDKMLEQTVVAIPDAKDRLAYIANLTEQAACKVLNATDVAMPIQERIEADAQQLLTRWDATFANKLSATEFRQLAVDTRTYLSTTLPGQVDGTKAQLMEIMMAQDFQDLTGQVIKKVVTLAQNLEEQLMGVLIEIMPDSVKTESVNSLLNGPVVKAEGRTDVVGSQRQVDDLLDSLGF